MATTTSLTTTYAGQLAGGVIMAAFKANETLQHITVKENIDYKQVVRKLVDDVSFAAPTCDFTPTGTVALTERILTLEKFQVHRQMCKKDFLTDWSANDAQNGSLNSEITEAIIANVLASIASKNETIIWSGANGTPGEYDGFETLFTADLTVIDGANDAAITSANVVAKIQAVIDLMPVGVLRATEKPKLYVGSKVHLAYVNAQTALGNGTMFNQEGVKLTFNGMFDIAVCPGMSNDTIVFAQPSNLWFGTNKMNDWNRVSVLDMEEQDLSDNVRFKAQFLAGVQYGIGSEIVMYKYTG